MRVRRITIKLKEPTRDGDTDTAHPLLTYRPNGPSAAQLARSTANGGASRPPFLRSPRPCRARSIRWAIPRPRCLPFAWRCWRTTRCRSSKPPCAVPMAARRSMTRSRATIWPWRLSRTYDGMMIAIPAPHWVLFRELSDQEFAHVLRELASSVKLSQISETSSRSQEEATRTHRLSEWKARLNRQDSWHKDDHVERAGLQAAGCYCRLHN